MVSGLGGAKRKWLFPTAVAVLGLALALVLALPAPAMGQQAKAVAIVFRDADPDLLVLENPVYALGLNKRNGAIEYIKEKASGTISTGSHRQSLWAAELPGQQIPEITGAEFQAGLPDLFRYAWSEDAKTLTLTYTSAENSPLSLDVTVEIRPSAGPYFDLRITVQNRTSGVIRALRFPNRLRFDAEDIAEALIPDNPGMILGPGFFTEQVAPPPGAPEGPEAPAYRRWWASYPPAFASQMAVKTEGGNFALYSLRGADKFWPVDMGWDRDPLNDAEVLLDYRFPLMLAPSATWTSPTVRVRVSQDFNETTLAYRGDNGIDTYPSAAAKLGAKFDALRRAPYLHMDPVLLNRPFRDWPQLFSTLPSPALIIPANYWPGGFHGLHPDVLPPDPAHGTTAELRAAIKAARDRGMLVMPMVLPNWWHENSPTLNNLPSPLAPRDVAMIEPDGRPAYAFWGLGDKEDWGYFVSAYHPFVRQRVQRLMQELITDLNSDLIFEDVIGAVKIGFDLNRAGPGAEPATDWLEHMREYKDANLVTEKGYDILTEFTVGFLGSAYVERRGSDDNIDGKYGAGNWRWFPLAGLLAHDKVLTYQYWADDAVNKHTLSWDLAFGFMLNQTLIDRSMLGPDAEPLDGPWLPVVADFQAHVAARYAGERMTAFSELPGGATRTTFETVTVLRNSDPARPYVSGLHTLAPQGVLATSASGDLVAGIFTAYNGAPLSPGEHYLIEERGAEAINVRQPMGADSDLQLNPLSGWQEGAALAVTVYAADGRTINISPATVSGGKVSFRYRRVMAGRSVAHYTFRPASQPVPPAPNQSIIRFKMGQRAYSVDGSSASMDVTPLIKDSRTFLPIRYVAEPLNATIGWDAGEGKITVSLGDRLVELWLGKGFARVGGLERPIDAANQAIAPLVVPPGRTMLPLRFVAEALDCKVDWNAAVQEITVSC
ncbi:MAG: copper amine oxidase N-terminal domain-containing protein [Firmicutes bacterium]|nr:copper amine oxidase N-terminal domain-containing protein [Bacillota bacterium]